MRSKLWLGLGLAGLLVAVGGVTVASASSDITTAKTIHFVARQTSFSFIDVGKKGFSDGDYIVATEDDIQAGKKIGHDAFKCTFIHGDTLCEAVYVLAQGHISVQSDVLPPARHFNGAVTGGTGIYQNVRGQLTVVPTSPTTANETLHLLP
jgi:hypothetical protein